MIDYREADVFSVELEAAGYDLVYADPPYAGCRFKYARQNGSRQWGRNARADFMRTLIARMDYARSPEGVCAVSMATPELDMLPLFPSKRRVFAWVKPFAVMRPGVWPAYAWEPVVAWGTFPSREWQRQAKTPHDWLNLSPRVPRKGGHETPKPEAFAEWVWNLTLGPRPGKVLELFAGTAPLARLAEANGFSATAVDLKRWAPTPRGRDETANG